MTEDWNTLFGCLNIRSSVDVSELKIILICNIWEDINDGNENLKATIPNENYDRSKTIGECGIFQLFG
jgi:hypothetical protein